MTDTDDDIYITNPNDPYQREWGIGSIVTTMAVAVVIAGIVTYEASRTAIHIPTKPSSTVPQSTTAGQNGSGPAPLQR